MGRLDGMVAIVTGTRPFHFLLIPILNNPTGAGSGFGAGISKGMASEGAKVLVCDINETGGQATVSSNPDALAFHRMDVTKSADWKATMDAVVEKWGKCDILVNNAGWSYTNKPTGTVTEEEFDKVFDVNVKGVYLGCNSWVDQAIERKEGGVIINIASVGATRPRPGLVWYNASKGAVWNVRLLSLPHDFFQS
jgi:NAD(P)-dependent dehydrogenase (short-subunit alcohol dehydrogenase family)